MSITNIKDFIGQRFFSIPKYQRSYSWERQQVRELFDDIRESQQTKSSHYIGTVVISRINDEKDLFSVVDGQQRLTTVMMIINALIKRMKDKEDQGYYTRLYIREKSNYRLQPLGRDREFFQKLLSNETLKPESKSQRYLMEVYEEIEKQLEAVLDIKEFMTGILSLELIEFIQECEGDAIRIFQTVNDRGKPLSTMEKLKSLLIYYSNKYLGKSLDSWINDKFGNVFESYDDIKKIGEDLSINVISRSQFVEDDILRYFFSAYDSGDFDPTASYVLNTIKTELNSLRSDANFNKLETTIRWYTETIDGFFNSFRKLMFAAKTDDAFYRLFVILGISATLYPIMIKLHQMGLLEKSVVLQNGTKTNVIKALEIVDIRVYKFRGTNPKADLYRMISSISETTTANDVVEKLTSFANNWMNIQTFSSNLQESVYPNSSLVHMFIRYEEKKSGSIMTIEQLKEKMGQQITIEHILSQTPNFNPVAYGFENDEDYLDYLNRLGNLIIIEKALNSSANQKVVSDKINVYDKSKYRIVRDFASEYMRTKKFDKHAIAERTKEIKAFIIQEWG